MDENTRKLMTMHKASHTRDYIDKLYEYRKQGRKGIAIIEDSVHALVWGLKDYKKESNGKLITATRNSTGNIKINRSTKTTEQKWKEKQLYTYFKRQTNEILNEMNNT